jgi:RNA 3'-terminal phosphate cyclase
MLISSVSMAHVHLNGSLTCTTGNNRKERLGRLQMCIQGLEISLKGLTNTPQDPSVDVIRAVTLPLAKVCGVEASLKSKQRAVQPEGAALVHLIVGSLKALDQPVRLLEEGLVRRVRGVAWTVNMSPQHATAAFSSAKGVLLKLLSDVQIFTDVVTVKAKPVRRSASQSQRPGAIFSSRCSKN